MNKITLVIPADAADEIQLIESSLQAKGISFTQEQSELAQKDASGVTSVVTLILIPLVTGVLGTLIGDIISNTALWRRFRYRLIGRRIVAEPQTTTKEPEIERQITELKKSMTQLLPNDTTTSQSNEDARTPRPATPNFPNLDP